MEAENLLQSLCERHGVDRARGERLLPLIRWALKGPLGSRARILEVVDRSLAKDAEGEPLREDELRAAAERAILLAVARVLHTWAPDQRALDFGIGGTD